MLDDSYPVDIRNETKMNMIKTDYSEAVYKTIATNRSVQLAIMRAFNILCCHDSFPDLRHTMPSLPMPLIRFSFLPSERTPRPGNTENSLLSFDDNRHSLHLMLEDDALLDSQGGTQSRSRTLLEHHRRLWQNLSVPPDQSVSRDLPRLLKASPQTHGDQVFPSIEWSDDDSMMLEEKTHHAFISRKRRRPRRGLVKCIKILSDLDMLLTTPPSRDTTSAPDEKRTRRS